MTKIFSSRGLQKPGRQLQLCAALALVVAAGLIAPPPAPGEWLVLNDGSTIETRGGWRTEGRLIVFTRPDGRLASLRSADVDLEASRRWTERARLERQEPESPAAPSAGARRPVLVLTDADVAHVGPGWKRERAAAEGENSAAGRSEHGITIRQWGQRHEESGGLVVFGVLENRSEHAASAIELGVVALDREGGSLDSARAVLHQTTLMPGQTTRFEAHFDPVPVFSSLDFRVESVALVVAEDQRSAESAAGV